MAKKKKQAASMLAKKQEPVELFSVYLVETKRQVYPGEGMAKSEAQRISDNLVQPTYIESRGLVD